MSSLLYREFSAGTPAVYHHPKTCCHSSLRTQEQNTNLIKLTKWFIVQKKANTRPWPLADRWVAGKQVGRQVGWQMVNWLEWHWGSSSNDKLAMSGCRTRLLLLQLMRCGLKTTVPAARLAKPRPGGGRDTEGRGKHKEVRENTKFWSGSWHN